MDDSISRQAALVAVKDALIAWSYMPEWRDEKILEAIAELPPALGTNLAQLGTDCISRQAAIDAIDEISREVDDGDGFNYAKWREYFCELPSEHGTNLAEVGTDCISRQAEIDALRDYLVGKRCPDDGTLTCRLIENEVINKLPPIQPKRGKWVDDGDPLMLTCENCGYGVIRYNSTPFCPNCGRRMVLDQ